MIWGMFSLLFAVRFGISLMSIRGILLGAILAAASFTDIVSYRIPDRLQAGGIVIFLITALFCRNPVMEILRGGSYGMLLAGSLLLLSLGMEHVTGRENLGGGDIKLFFMTGLYLGSVWELLFYLILSCSFGLLTAVFCREERIPFAPAIAAACMVMLLYGESLTGWYTALF